MLTKLSRRLEKIFRHPLNSIKRVDAYRTGYDFGSHWQDSTPHDSSIDPTIQMSQNPLREYFDQHDKGPGIFKWLHYFQLYHNHFAKFVGREVHVVEVGVYSGGSLPMWRKYFGPRCHVYGIDIEASCKSYEGDDIRIFIGDQADRQFWADFRRQVPVVDILIDDGGHTPVQQMVTLEEMLPHLRPGGVYVCEDIHDHRNVFSAYVAGLSRNLNTWQRQPGKIATTPTKFQQAIQAIHLYPYMTVVEKLDTPVDRFVAVRHGTQWQP